MSDRMYQITAMGVMDQMMVGVKVYSAEDGHWTPLMQSSVMIGHEVEDSAHDDLLAIARALRARFGQLDDR